MRVVVIGGVEDLAADCRSVATRFKAVEAKVVSKSVRDGVRTMKAIAQAKVGPHGSNYPKRITGESSGLTGEFGPHDGGTPVGAGWRHGRNTDTPQTADVIGPRFAKAALDAADRLFWP